MRTLEDNGMANQGLLPRTQSKVVMALSGNKKTMPIDLIFIYGPIRPGMDWSMSLLKALSPDVNITLCSLDIVSCQPACM